MREKTVFSKLAFTLIELLIVVAIIAILAAIAVPNFLRAQIRAKITRVRVDLRSIAIALEAYSVDWNTYPCDGEERTGRCQAWGANTAAYNLTTPIAYLSSIPTTPFDTITRIGFSVFARTHYFYASRDGYGDRSWWPRNRRSSAPNSSSTSPAAESRAAASSSSTPCTPMARGRRRSAC